jgi:hypothetical protein
VILLVAITVVLAAVLYVLVSDVTRGTTGAPLGSALALGPATALTGTSATSRYCATGHGCYTVSIATAASSLTIGDLRFAVQNAPGENHLVSRGSGAISLVDPSGKIVAKSPPITVGKPLLVASWTFSPGFSAGTAFSPQFTLWIEFGIPNPANHGFILQATGSGPFDGTISYQLP